MIKTIGVAAILTALAGTAYAGTVDITTYNNFAENSGVAIGFSNPVFSSSFNSSGNGFFLDFNNQVGSVGTVVSPYDAYTNFGAVLTGEIYAPTAGTYQVQVGGDDGTYLFINNALVADLPGIHPTDYSTVTVSLAAGDNPFKIEYYNGLPVGANIALNVFDGASIAAVPEPSTWAMMILGFAGIGFLAYRRRSLGAALRIA
jgi:hypothetical protein